MLQINNENYDLMFNLIRQMGWTRNWKENFVFSPIGISVLLGIIAEGSYDTTRDEIIEIIGDKFITNFSRRKYIDKKCMKLFTILFHSLPIRTTYTLKIRDKYGTFFCQTNCLKNYELLRKINYWISDVTNDSITWSIDSNNFNNTKLSFIACGTLMLKVGWCHNFKCTKSVFTLINGKNIPIKAICTKKIFKFTGTSIPNVNICEIPFNNPRYSCIIVMPCYYKDFYKIVQTLNISMYQNWIHYLRPLKVRVTIPKFSIYTSESIENYLINNGVTQLFSTEANLSFIFPSITKLNHIITSTYILVDEDGIISSEQQPKNTLRYNVPCCEPEFEFNINKPFLFIVHDYATNCVAYCCTIIDPTMSTLK